MPAQSSIWSSLFTLKSLSWFASTTSNQSRSYLLQGETVDTPTLPVFKRHQILANAIALIGASAPNSDTVTACSVEIVPTHGSGEQYNLAITLRIAQNGGLRPNDRRELQSIVDTAVSHVTSYSPRVLLQKEQRYKIIDIIAKKVILSLVVKRCQKKLAGIIGTAYAAPFKDWYLAEKEKGFPLDAYITHPIIKSSDICLEHIYDACEDDGTRKRSEVELYRAVYAADMFSVLLELYKDEWSKWPVIDEDADMAEEDGVNEALDDTETLDVEALRKPQIYCFMNKLRRYVVACISVIRELVVLYCFGNKFTVSVEGVPMVENTLAHLPIDEGEYLSFEEFIKEDPRIKVNIKTLDPGKIDAIRNCWADAHSETNRLILHAELQLALFYSLNFEFTPMHGFIGVSKHCCFCCGFVLKHLQDPNYPESAGQPINFVVEETHGHCYPLWLFPDPSTQIISTNKMSDNLTSIAHAEVIQHYANVRKELEAELAYQVKALLNKIEKNVVEASNSSRISVDGFGDRITEDDFELFRKWRNEYLEERVI